MSSLLLVFISLFEEDLTYEIYNLLYADYYGYNQWQLTYFTIVVNTISFLMIWYLLIRHNFRHSNAIAKILCILFSLLHILNTMYLVLMYLMFS